jgi:hypothetical protein
MWEAAYELEGRGSSNDLFDFSSVTKNIMEIFQALSYVSLIGNIAG